MYNLPGIQKNLSDWSEPFLPPKFKKELRVGRISYGGAFLGSCQALASRYEITRPKLQIKIHGFHEKKKTFIFFLVYVLIHTDYYQSS
jgi:hypothetical protein